MASFEHKFQFTKMHGTGNDFVVVEKSALPEGVDFSRLAKIACDRKFGIGSDGLIIIAPHSDADFEMIFFNPDGSSAEMCGNGIRCLGKYVFDRGLTQKKDLKIKTGAGILNIVLFNNQNGMIESVETAMGKPDFTRKNIPIKGDGETALAETIQLSDGTKIEFNGVSMGNPHAIILVDDVANFPVSQIGPQIETHNMFPQRTNVEFVEHVSPEYIKVRIWERGAGETLSCGTGVCAASAVMRRMGLIGQSVKVSVRGGELQVRFDKDDMIYLKGPAEEIFTGRIS